MTSATIRLRTVAAAGLPAPAAKWTGLAKYSFIGGNNDPDQVPVEGLIDAVNAVLKREGKTLATYGLASGPQGYRPLREFLAAKLKRDAGIDCVADDILIVSGSLQALDLVNQTLLARGDTVIIERETYQGALNRLTRLGVNVVGIPLDHEGMRMDALAAAWPTSRAEASRRNISTPSRPCRTRPAPSCPDAPRRATETVPTIWRADLRGRLLCRPDLGRATTARDICDERGRQRHPYRLVFQIDRAGVEGWLHRGGMERCCRGCCR